MTCLFFCKYGSQGCQPFSLFPTLGIQDLFPPAEITEVMLWVLLSFFSRCQRKVQLIKYKPQIIKKPKPNIQNPQSQTSHRGSVFSSRVINKWVQRHLHRILEVQWREETPRSQQTFIKWKPVSVLIPFSCRLTLYLFYFSCSMAQFFSFMQNTTITKQITCVLCSAGRIIMHIRISKRLLKKLCTARLLSKAGYEQCISCVMLMLFPADRQRKGKWQHF